MGERAKKKRAMEAKARRANRAAQLIEEPDPTGASDVKIPICRARQGTQLVEGPSTTDPTGTSESSDAKLPTGTRSTKKTAAAPPSRVPSSVSTRRSIRHASTLESGTSAKGHGNESMARPQRAAAKVLLQQLQLGKFETESTDDENPPQMESDEDEISGDDEGSGHDSDSESSDIEFISNGEIKRASATQEGLRRAKAHGAQKKPAPKLQAIDEEESSEGKSCFLNSILILKLGQKPSPGPRPMVCKRRQRSKLSMRRSLATNVSHIF